MTTAHNADTLTYLPITALVRSPHNMRQPPLSKQAKTQRKQHIEALAASIAAQGILQNLVVHPIAEDDTVKAVSAGWTRCEAVRLLVERQQWDETRLLPCKVVPETEAVNASLTENVQRNAAHPADEFEAFKRLRDDGMSVATIAAQYGVTQQLVLRRLALADVSPRFMAMFRKGDITLDVMMAFTLTTDQAWQEKVWDTLPKHYRTPHHIRAELTKEELPSGHRLVKFVTVKAYEKAGGVVRRDLFSDSGACSIADRALVFQLAQTKLDAAATEIRAEGFSWVLALPECSHADLADYAEVPMIRRQPTKKEQKQLDKLGSALDAIDTQLSELDQEGEYDNESEERLSAERSTLEERRDAIESSLTEPDPTYTDVAGAIVTVDYEGALTVMRHLVKKQDAARIAKSKAATKVASVDVSTDQEPKGAAFSERLTQTFTAHVTAALQVSLLQRPQLAYALLAHSMLRDVCNVYLTSPLAQVRTSTHDHALEGLMSAEAPALVAIRSRIEEVRAQVPEDITLEWLCEQPAEFLLSIIVLGAACSINATRGNGDLDEDVKALAVRAQLDMREWWSATPDTVFNHVTKQTLANIVTGLGSADVAEALLKEKKARAVELAAAACAAQGGWIPEVMKFT